MADAPVINTSTTSSDEPSAAVLDAILTPKKETPVEKVAEEAVKVDPKPAPDDGESGDDVGDEGEDAGEDGEDTQPDDEGKKPDTEEDIDEYLVDVVINGKPTEVKLKDLKANYSGNKYTEANIQKAVETRKAAEAEAHKLFEGNKQAQAKLQQIDTILNSFAQPNIDWQKLKETDPQAYIIKREEQREAVDYQAQVRNEAQRIQKEQEVLTSDAKSRYLKDEADQLAAKLPELADPQKAKVVMGSMVKGAKEFYGYEQPEVEAVMDHRALLVLNDAVKWRQHLAKKTEALSKVPDAPKKITLRTQAAQPAMASAKKLELANLKRARESGRPEDVAATLIMRKSARK